MDNRIDLTLGLNANVSEMERAIEQLRSRLSSSPIGVDVEVNPTALQKVLEGVTQKVVLNPASRLQSESKSSALKSLREGVKQGTEAGQKEGLLSFAGLFASLGAILRGGFEAIGDPIGRAVGQGVAAQLEKVTAGAFGSFEFLGQRSVELMTASLNSLPSEVGKALEFVSAQVEADPELKQLRDDLKEFLKVDDILKSSDFQELAQELKESVREVRKGYLNLVGEERLLAAASVSDAGLGKRQAKERAIAIPRAAERTIEALSGEFASGAQIEFDASVLDKEIERLNAQLEEGVTSLEEEAELEKRIPELQRQRGDLDKQLAKNAAQVESHLKELQGLGVEIPKEILRATEFVESERAKARNAPQELEKKLKKQLKTQSDELEELVFAASQALGFDLQEFDLAAPVSEVAVAVATRIAASVEDLKAEALANLKAGDDAAAREILNRSKSAAKTARVVGLQGEALAVREAEIRTQVDRARARVPAAELTAARNARKQLRQGLGSALSSVSPKLGDSDSIAKRLQQAEIDRIDRFQKEVTAKLTTKGRVKQFFESELQAARDKLGTIQEQLGQSVELELNAIASDAEDLLGFVEIEIFSQRDRLLDLDTQIVRSLPEVRSGLESERKVLQQELSALEQERDLQQDRIDLVEIVRGTEERLARSTQEFEALSELRERTLSRQKEVKTGDVLRAETSSLLSRVADRDAAATLNQVVEQVAKRIGVEFDAQTVPSIVSDSQFEKVTGVGRPERSGASFAENVSAIVAPEELIERAKSGIEALSDDEIGILAHEVVHFYQTLGKSIDIAAPTREELSRLGSRIELSVANAESLGLDEARTRPLETEAYLFQDRYGKEIGKELKQQSLEARARFQIGAGGGKIRDEFERGIEKAISSLQKLRANAGDAREFVDRETTSAFEGIVELRKALGEQVDRLVEEIESAGDDFNLEAEVEKIRAVVGAQNKLLKQTLNKTIERSLVEIDRVRTAPQEPELGEVAQPSQNEGLRGSLESLTLKELEVIQRQLELPLRKKIGDRAENKAERIDRVIRDADPDRLQMAVPATVDLTDEERGLGEALKQLGADELKEALGSIVEDLKSAISSGIELKDVSALSSLEREIAIARRQLIAAMADPLDKAALGQLQGGQARLAKIEQITRSQRQKIAFQQSQQQQTTRVGQTVSQPMRGGSPLALVQGAESIGKELCECAHRTATVEPAESLFESLTRAVASISEFDLDRIEIPQLEVFRGGGGVAAQYVPESNTVRVSEQTKLELDRGMIPDATIAAVVHELRHAVQAEFGRLDIESAAASIELLRPTQLEDDRHQLSEFARRSTDAARGIADRKAILALEEDAYTFQLRHTQDVLKLVKAQQLAIVKEAKNIGRNLAEGLRDPVRDIAIAAITPDRFDDLATSTIEALDGGLHGIEIDANEVAKILEKKAIGAMSGLALGAISHNPIVIKVAADLGEKFAEDTRTALENAEGSIGERLVTAVSEVKFDASKIQEVLETAALSVARALASPIVVAAAQAARKSQKDIDRGLASVRGSERLGLEGVDEELSALKQQLGIRPEDIKTPVRLPQPLRDPPPPVDVETEIRRLANEMGLSLQELRDRKRQSPEVTAEDNELTRALRSLESTIDRSEVTVDALVRDEAQREEQRTRQLADFLEAVEKFERTASDGSIEQDIQSIEKLARGIKQRTRLLDSEGGLDLSRLKGLSLDRLRDVQDDLVESVAQVRAQVLSSQRSNVLDRAVRAAGDDGERVGKELASSISKIENAISGGKLSTARAEIVKVEDRLEELGVSLVDLYGDLDRARESVSDFSSTIDSAVSPIGNLKDAAIDLVKGFLGLNALGRIQDFFAQISDGAIEANLQLESLERRLALSSSDPGASLKFLSQTADELGINFESSANAYAGFAASLKGSAVESETEEIFKSVSKGVSALSLGASDAEGVFLALQQMAAKGVVSAEEFRQQLGERLPVATKLGTEALQRMVDAGTVSFEALGKVANSSGEVAVTTADFVKFLNSGKLLSGQFLPELAAEFEEEFGSVATDAQTTQQSIERFNNAVLRTQQVLGKSFAPFFSKGASTAAAALNLFSENADIAAKTTRYLAIAMTAAFGKQAIVGLTSGVAKLIQMTFGLKTATLAAQIQTLGWQTVGRKFAASAGKFALQAGLMAGAVEAVSLAFDTWSTIDKNAKRTRASIKDVTAAIEDLKVAQAALGQKELNIQSDIPELEGPQGFLDNYARRPLGLTTAASAKLNRETVALGQAFTAADAVSREYAASLARVAKGEELTADEAEKLVEALNVAKGAISEAAAPTAQARRQQEIYVDSLSAQINHIQNLTRVTDKLAQSQLELETRLKSITKAAEERNAALAESIASGETSAESAQVQELENNAETLGETLKANQELLAVLQQQMERADFATRDDAAEIQDRASELAATIRSGRAEYAEATLAVRNAIEEQQLGDFDEARSILDSRLTRRLVDEEQHAQKSLEIASMRADAELEIIDRKLDLLDSADKEGREALEVRREESLARLQAAEDAAVQGQIDAISKTFNIEQQTRSAMEAMRLRELRSLQEQGVISAEEAAAERIQIEEARISREIANEEEKVQAVEKLLKSPNLSNVARADLSSTLAESLDRQRELEESAIEKRIEMVNRIGEKETILRRRQDAERLAQIDLAERQGTLSAEAAAKARVDVTQARANEEIAIEQKRIRALRDLLDDPNITSERRIAIEEQLTSAIERQTSALNEQAAAAREVVDARLNALAQANDRLLDAANQTEADRGLAVARAINSGAISAEEGEERKLRATKTRISAEIAAEESKISQLRDLLGNRDIDAATRTDLEGQIRDSELVRTNLAIGLAEQERQIRESQRAARERRNELLNDKRLDAVVQAETQQNLEIARAVNAGAISTEEAESRKLQATKTRITAEIELEKAKASQLRRLLGSESDKGVRTDIESRIRDSQLAQARLAVSLAEQEQQQKSLVTDRITRRANLAQIALERQLLGEEEIVAVMGHQAELLDLQSALMQGRADLASTSFEVEKVRLDLTSARTQAEIESLDRAIELQTQVAGLSSGSPIGAAADDLMAALGHAGKDLEQLYRARAEREAESIGNRRTELNLSQQQEKVELQFERQQAQIAQRQEQIRARSAIVEAQIASAKARGAIASAQSAVSAAKQRNDIEAIASAERDLAAARIEAANTDRALGLAQENLGVVQQVGQMQQSGLQMQEQALALQQEAAREQLEREIAEQRATELQSLMNELVSKEAELRDAARENEIENLEKAIELQVKLSEEADISDRVKRSGTAILALLEAEGQTAAELAEEQQRLEDEQLESKRRQIEAEHQAKVAELEAQKLAIDLAQQQLAMSDRMVENSERQLEVEQQRFELMMQAQAQQQQQFEQIAQNQQQPTSTTTNPVGTSTSTPTEQLSGIELLEREREQEQNRRQLGQMIFEAARGRAALAHAEAEFGVGNDPQGIVSRLETQLEEAEARLSVGRFAGSNPNTEIERAISAQAREMADRRQRDTGIQISDALLAPRGVPAPAPVPTPEPTPVPVPPSVTSPPSVSVSVSVSPSSQGSGPPPQPSPTPSSPSVSPQVASLQKQAIDAQIEALELQRRGNLELLEAEQNQKRVSRAMEAHNKLVETERENKQRTNELDVKSVELMRDRASAQSQVTQAAIEAQKSQAQGQMQVLDRALELRRRLNDETLDPRVRQEIERQLDTAGLGGASEVEILAQQQSKQEEIFNLERQRIEEANRAEMRKLEFEAKMDEIRGREQIQQAKLNERKAEQLKIEAQIAIAKATQNEDAAGIAVGQELLAVAEEQISITKEATAQVREEVALRQEMFQQQKQELGIKLQSQLTEQNITRELQRQQSALGRAEALASGGGRFGGFRAEGGEVKPGQFYVGGEFGPEAIVSGGKIKGMVGLGGPEFFKVPSPGIVLPPQETMMQLMRGSWQHEVNANLSDARIVDAIAKNTRVIQQTMGLLVDRPRQAPVVVNTGSSPGFDTVKWAQGLL